MKRYEVYTYIGFGVAMRHETDNLDEAIAKAREIEETATDNFEGTALYDNLHCEWFGRHERKIAETKKAPVERRRGLHPYGTRRGD